MTKKKVVFFCKLSLAGIILYYIFEKREVIEILTVIKSAKLFYVTFALLLYIFSRYIMAYQSKIVLVNQGIKLSVFKIFVINLESGFYDLCIPGGVGSSVVKWHKFSKPEGKRIQAFTSIAVTRLINVVIMGVIGIIALLMKNPFRNSFGLQVVLISFIIVVFVFLLAVFNKTVSALFEKQLEKLLYIFPVFISDIVLKFRDSFNKLKKLTDHDFLIIVFVAIFLHLLNTFIFYLISASLHIFLSIFAIAWITSTVLLINMIPISISGLGVREGALLFLLDKFQIPGAEALAFSLIIFGIGALLSLVGGCIEAQNILRNSLIGRNIFFSCFFRK